MSDVPVTFTFDNIAGIALQEVIEPLEVQRKDLESKIAKLSKNISDLQDQYDKEYVGIVRKRHKKLIDQLSKLGNLEFEDCLYDYPDPRLNIRVTFWPDHKSASGELEYYLDITKKEYATIKSLKEIVKLEKEYTKLNDTERKLVAKINLVKTSLHSVKSDLMTGFINSHSAHLDFKNLIKQKIKEKAG